MDELGDIRDQPPLHLRLPRALVCIGVIGTAIGLTIAWLYDHVGFPRPLGVRIGASIAIVSMLSFIFGYLLWLVRLIARDWHSWWHRTASK